MRAERWYAAAAVLGATGLIAATAGGLVFSLVHDGGLPRPVLDYAPAVRALLEQGHTDEAIHELQAAALLDPQNPQSLELLAEVAGRAGDHESLMLALRRLVKLHPDDAARRVELSEALIAEVRAGDARRPERQLRRAILNSEAALRAAPDSARAHRAIGEAWKLLGETEQAEFHFAEADRLGRGVPDQPAPTRPAGQQPS